LAAIHSIEAEMISDQEKDGFFTKRGKKKKFLRRGKKRGVPSKK
jgi:hypothetical protein